MENSSDDSVSGIGLMSPREKSKWGKGVSAWSQDAACGQFM